MKNNSMKQFAAFLAVAGLLTALGQGCLSPSSSQPQSLPTPAPGAVEPVAERVVPEKTQESDMDDLEAELEGEKLEPIENDIKALQEQANQLY